MAGNALLTCRGAKHASVAAAAVVEGVIVVTTSLSINVNIFV